MSELTASVEQRSKTFKSEHSQTEESLRNRRRQTRVELRKAKRDEHRWKKRNILSLGFQEPEVKQTNMISILEGLKNPERQIQLNSTQSLRHILADSEHPVKEEDFDVAIIPCIIALLKPDQLDSIGHSLRFAATLIVTNIACISSALAGQLVQEGAVEQLIEILSYPDEKMNEQAVWALGNLAGDAIEFRNYILKFKNFIPSLNSLVQRATRLSTVRYVTWTLSNICRKEEMDILITKQCLSTLSWLLHSTDDVEILTDGCWAVRNICSGSSEVKLNAVIESGITRRLVELLVYKELSIVAPALRSIGYLVGGDVYQTQVVINCGTLKFFNTLLSHPNEEIRFDTCWALSNISAGSSVQIQNVLDCNLLPPMITLLKKGSQKVQQEVAWALCNMLSCGNKSQVAVIISTSCIAGLCKLLHENCSIEFLRVLLDAFEVSLLSVPDPESLRFEIEENADDVLNKLLNHDNEQVSALASRVLNLVQYGEENENENENHNHNYNYNQNQTKKYEIPSCYLPKKLDNVENHETPPSMPYSYHF